AWLGHDDVRAAAHGPSSRRAAGRGPVRREPLPLHGDAPHPRRDAVVRRRRARARTRGRRPVRARRLPRAPAPAPPGRVAGVLPAARAHGGARAARAVPCDAGHGQARQRQHLDRHLQARRVRTVGARRRVADPGADRGRRDPGRQCPGGGRRGDAHQPARAAGRRHRRRRPGDHRGADRAPGAPRARRGRAGPGGRDRRGQPDAREEPRGRRRPVPVRPLHGPRRSRRADRDPHARGARPRAGARPPRDARSGVVPERPRRHAGRHPLHGRDHDRADLQGRAPGPERARAPQRGVQLRLRRRHDRDAREPRVRRARPHRRRGPADAGGAGRQAVDAGDVRGGAGGARRGGGGARRADAAGRRVRRVPRGAGGVAAAQVRHPRREPHRARRGRSRRGERRRAGGAPDLGGQPHLRRGPVRRGRAGRPARVAEQPGARHRGLRPGAPGGRRGGARRVRGAAQPPRGPHRRPRHRRQRARPATGPGRPDDEDVCADPGHRRGQVHAGRPAPGRDARGRVRPQPVHRRAVLVRRPDVGRGRREAGRSSRGVRPVRHRGRRPGQGQVGRVRPGGPGEVRPGLRRRPRHRLRPADRARARRHAPRGADRRRRGARAAAVRHRGPHAGAHDRGGQGPSRRRRRHVPGRFAQGHRATGQRTDVAAGPGAQAGQGLRHRDAADRRPGALLLRDAVLRRDPRRRRRGPPLQLLTAPRRRAAGRGHGAEPAHEQGAGANVAHRRRVRRQGGAPAVLRGRGGRRGVDGQPSGPPRPRPQHGHAHGGQAPSVRGHVLRPRRPEREDREDPVRLRVERRVLLRRVAADHGPRAAVGRQRLLGRDVPGQRHRVPHEPRFEHGVPLVRGHPVHARRRGGDGAPRARARDAGRRGAEGELLRGRHVDDVRAHAVRPAAALRPDAPGVGRPGGDRRRRRAPRRGGAVQRREPVAQARAVGRPAQVRDLLHVPADEPGDRRGGRLHGRERPRPSRRDRDGAGARHEDPATRRGDAGHRDGTDPDRAGRYRERRQRELDRCLDGHRPSGRRRRRRGTSAPRAPRGVLPQPAARRARRLGQRVGRGVGEDRHRREHGSGRPVLAGELREPGAGGARRRRPAARRRADVLLLHLLGRRVRGRDRRAHRRGHRPAVRPDLRRRADDQLRARLRSDRRRLRPGPRQRDDRGALLPRGRAAVPVRDVELQAAVLEDDPGEAQRRAARVRAHRHPLRRRDADRPLRDHVVEVDRRAAARPRDVGVLRDQAGGRGRPRGGGPPCLDATRVARDRRAHPSGVHRAM
ncbi:MAG: Xanthine dehydrogenase, molybdenum binding subunit, partial [uncultured Solirubrobacteraceae bacterium]